MTNITAQKLQDFFTYFDKENENHVRSIEILHEDLTTSTPKLLDDSTSWITTYRTPPEYRRRYRLALRFACR